MPVAHTSKSQPKARGDTIPAFLDAVETAKQQLVAADVAAGRVQPEVVYANQQRIQEEQIRQKKQRDAEENAKLAAFNRTQAEESAARNEALRAAEVAEKNKQARHAAFNENRNEVRKESNAERDAESKAYQKSFKSAKTPTERIKINQERSDRLYTEKHKMDFQKEIERKRDPKTGLLRTVVVPNKATAVGLKDAITRDTDRAVTKVFGGVVDALAHKPTQKETYARFNQETKKLSTVVRNKNLGKNAFNTVIGVGSVRQQRVVTDGHGRSGQRATLEWRRENRQYVSPERAAKAEINQDWLSNVLGTQPEPVRHRKHRAGGHVLSPLDRLNRMINGK